MTLDFLLKSRITYIESLKKAKNVILQLIIHNKSLILTIEDDGKGFKNPISSSKNGLGIKNIKNRIASIDGMMQIDSNADGTSITIEVNL